MMRTLFPLGLGLALAACNQQPSVSLTNATPEEAQKAAQRVAAVELRPGAWETRIEVVSVESPGMPAGIADQIKRQSARTVNSCMTPEQAKKPGPETFTQQNGSKDCTFPKFAMSGGTLDATMLCKTGQQEMAMKMTGSYTPETIDYRADMDMKMPAGQSMKMNTKITGRRTGECTPDKKG